MNESTSLYEPSLESEYEETKSYDLNRFYLVAFFGGVIPVIVLSIRNAKWLHASKKLMYFIAGVGGAILAAKFIVAFLMANGLLAMEERELRLGYRVGSLLFVLLITQFMKKPFHQHMMTDGTLERLLKPAVIWSVVGGVIEFGLIYGLIMPFVG